MRGVAVLSSLVLVSCTHVVQLEPAASGVEVSKDTPVGCRDLGEVYGKSNADDPEDAMKGARNDLRNKAHAMGGNHVVLETDNSRPVSGNATVGTEILLGGRPLDCGGAPSRARARSAPPHSAAGRRATQHTAPEHTADEHPARGKPPTGAGGFTFGAAPDVVQGKCEAAGHHYETANDGTATCDGSPVDLGAPTTVTLHYCQDHLCRISLVLQPGAAKLADSLAAVEQALIGKYGRVGNNRVAIPTDCTGKLAQCIEQGKAQVELDWHFPKDNIKLEVLKPDQDGASPTIHIAYDTSHVWKKKKPSIGAGL